MDVEATIAAIEMLRGRAATVHVDANGGVHWKTPLEPVVRRILENAIWALESSLRNYLTGRA